MSSEREELSEIREWMNAFIAEEGIAYDGYQCVIAFPTGNYFYDGDVAQHTFDNQTKIKQELEKVFPDYEYTFEIQGSDYLPPFYPDAIITRKPSLEFTPKNRLRLFFPVTVNPAKYNA